MTGGASGIGLAIVEAVLAEGWRAVVADLDPAKPRPLSGRPWSARGAGQVPADERRGRGCRHPRRGGHRGGVRALTGVVNSAGIGRDVPALDTSVDLFRRMLEVNLIGSFVVSREAAKHMQARGGGSIVNIASVSGIKGNKGRVAYGASKGGVAHHDQGHGGRAGIRWASG